MLHTITTISDDLATLIKDDPVRPEIPLSDRINSNSRIYMLKDGDETLAVTCVKFLETIPSAVDELVITIGSATTAVFYTIWSYTAGAGRQLIVEAQRSIELEFPEIQTYVTLSPKTEMARRFHLKNGARELRENSDTVNYIYK
jgi:Malonyl-CoA decarboxylase C-terminal domain